MILTQAPLTALNIRQSCVEVDSLAHIVLKWDKILSLAVVFHFLVFARLRSVIDCGLVERFGDLQGFFGGNLEVLFSPPPLTRQWQANVMNI